MARRRMIEITTSHDKELNSLSVFAELLYHRILPHTDDYGRFEGDPEVVRARVMPLRKKSIAVIEEAMREISAAGLWVWFKLPNGKSVVQYKAESFERINAFLIKNRGNSEFPPYKKEYELICGDMPPYRIDSNKHKAISTKQKEFLRPTVEEVIHYFTEKGFPESLARRAFDGYEVANWHDSQGKKIQNWKQKMIQVWFKEENRNGQSGKGRTAATRDDINRTVLRNTAPIDRSPEG
jgi:hypothetical protein